MYTAIRYDNIVLVSVRIELQNGCLAQPTQINLTTQLQLWYAPDWWQALSG